MKILLISGFLGAGKTTFIKALARHTGKEFAILENEYGAVGIDGDLLTGGALGEKENIWEMAEGCICCSRKGDFAATVLTIANTVAPDYLVIEPTGVAMLSQIVRNLQKILYERIELLGPITIVDGHSYHRYMREYPELYRNQIASASTVIVSKMEQASPEERRRLEEALRAVNPKGQILSEHYSRFDEARWLSLLGQSFEGEETGAEAEEPVELPDTFSLREASVDSPERLFWLLEALVRGKFGNIFRAKGQLLAGGQRLRFDVADGLYSVTGGTAETEEKAVFIGTGIDRGTLRRYLEGAPEKIPVGPGLADLRKGRRRR